MSKFWVKITLFLWASSAYSMGPSVGGALAVWSAPDRVRTVQQLNLPEFARTKEMFSIAARFLAICHHKGTDSRHAQCTRFCPTAYNMASESRIEFRCGLHVVANCPCPHLQASQIAQLCRTLNKHCYGGDETALRATLELPERFSLSQEGLLSWLQELLHRDIRR